MPSDAAVTWVIALLVVSLVGAIVILVWRLGRGSLPKTGSRSRTILATRSDFPAAGLLVPEAVLRAGGSNAAAVWGALETAAAPMALEYRPISDLELTKYRTIPVNASVQQALVNVMKSLNPRDPTLFRVVLPKGAQLVRAAGRNGFRGFARNAKGISAQALLKPVAVGGAAAAGWPIFAVAGTVMLVDMVAQRELRAHQQRMESMLGRQEERYYTGRIANQRSADLQLSRAISLMLDGQSSTLEVGLKAADDEFHLAQQFLAKYRGVLDDLADAKGRVDYRRLELALGGRAKDVDYFVRELHLSRGAIELRRKSLVADAAAAALADPENPYAALRKHLERQVQQLEEADTVAAELTERLSRVNLKGRWHDAVTGVWRGTGKSLKVREERFRSQIALPSADESADAELRFIALPSGEIVQVVPEDSGDLDPNRDAS